MGPAARLNVWQTPDREAVIVRPEELARMCAAGEFGGEAVGEQAVKARITPTTSTNASLRMPSLCPALRRIGRHDCEFFKLVSSAEGPLP